MKNAIIRYAFFSSVYRLIFPICVEIKLFVDSKDHITSATILVKMVLHKNNMGMEKISKRITKICVNKNIYAQAFDSDWCSVSRVP